MDKSNRDDLTRFRNAIAGMALTFRCDVSETIFDGYWMGLSDLAIEAIEASVVRAIRTCKFLPTVVELRELSGEVPTEARALRAWEAFNRAVVSHGYYHSVDFDDRVINATIRNLGGWEAVCTIEGRDEWDIWLRKRFIKTYTVLAVGGISEDGAQPLIGCFDRENAFNGYHDHVKGPALIECGLPPHPPGVVPALPASRTPAQLTNQNLLQAIGHGTDSESSDRP